MKLSTLAAALLLAGCASHPPLTQPQEAQYRIDEAEINAAPDWFTKPPVEHGVIFAAGTALSPDLQMASDKAVLLAERQVADQVHGQLSADLKDYLDESTGTPDRGERVVHSLIAGAVLSGYEITERKVTATGGGFRAFVLVRYSPAVAIKAVAATGDPEAKARASKAFEDLERDIQGQAGAK